MYNLCAMRTGRAGLVVLAGVIVCSLVLGCGGATNAFRNFFGSPYPYYPSGSSGTTGPGSSGVSTGGTLDTSGGTSTDPCSEPQGRKFVRISMRNLAEDYVHYFLILIAYENSDTYPDGAVCEDDIALYQRNGSILVPAGRATPLGRPCIRGPEL